MIRQADANIAAFAQNLTPGERLPGCGLQLSASFVGTMWTMEPRDRLLGPIAAVRSPPEPPPRVTHDSVRSVTPPGYQPSDPSGRHPDEVVVDFGSLVTKLILFDRIVVDTVNFREFEFLVRKFGFDGLKELLASGRVRIRAGWFGIMQGGQLPRTNGPILPLGSYSFGAFRPTHPDHVIHEDLQRINQIAGLNGRQQVKVRQLIARVLVEATPEDGNVAEAQLMVDLNENGPILKRGVALATQELYRRKVDPGSFDLDIERISEVDWRTTTDLAEHVGLTDEQTHLAVERGILAVGSRHNRRLVSSRFRALGQPSARSTRSWSTSWSLPLVRRRFLAGSIRRSSTPLDTLTSSAPPTDRRIDTSRCSGTAHAGLSCLHRRCAPP